MEREYEKRLHGTAPTGAIFALKNFGWRDRQDVELTGKEGGPVEVKNDLDLLKYSEEELITLAQLIAKGSAGASD